MSKYEEIKGKIEAEAAGSPGARTIPVPCAFCKRGGNGDWSCACGFFERRYSKFKGCFSGELLDHDPKEGGAK